MERDFPQQLWWAVDDSGHQIGPVLWAQILNMVISGELTQNSLLWSEGLPTWTAAAQLPGLSIPPPMPTPAAIQRTDPKPTHAKRAGFWGDFFKPVEDRDDAIKRLRDAGTATFVLAGMEALGAILYASANGKTEDTNIVLVGFALLIGGLIIAGVAMRRGRGGVTVPTIVFGLFAIEIFFKLMAFKPSMAGWLIFYAFFAGALISGVRAGIFLRRDLQQLSLRRRSTSMQ